MTIKDTWPSDNSTNPASPDYCYVRSWALSFNGGVLGTLSGEGQFTAQYVGTGQVYGSLHEGPIYPNTMGGLYVSVWERTPIQANAAVSIGPVAAPPLVAQGWNQPAPILNRTLSLPSPGANHQLVLDGNRSCTECHSTPHGSAAADERR
jgi:hypothetical protein